MTRETTTDATSEARCVYIKPGEAAATLVNVRLSVTPPPMLVSDLCEHIIYAHAMLEEAHRLLLKRATEHPYQNARREAQRWLDDHKKWKAGA